MTGDVMRALGKEVKQRRKAMKLSQEEFAERAGVSRNTIGSGAAAAGPAEGPRGSSAAGTRDKARQGLPGLALHRTIPVDRPLNHF